MVCDIASDTPVQLLINDGNVEMETGSDDVGQVQQSQPLNIEQMLPEPTEDLDREDIITNIRDLIEMRDKCMAKNANYQNLLGEYFRRKRV